LKPGRVATGLNQVIGVDHGDTATGKLRPNQSLETKRVLNQVVLL
jgi:hypothetical protein